MYEAREGYLNIPLPKKGACGMCGETHGVEEPHNRNSLLYQHRFRKMNRRYPTWEDAMSHCSEKTKEKWKRKLEKKGIIIREQWERLPE